MHKPDIPHFLPPLDALHQCGSTIQRYQNTQNKMDRETLPLYLHPRRSHQNP
uniref:Uncharacterized protein n=1 Tax=Medicago truncatula TaxID=3880 RepID=I3SLP3_MEDTR|nr:unknown [Medicago truncatula]